MKKIWQWNLWHLGPAKLWFDFSPIKRGLRLALLEVDAEGFTVELLNCFLFVCWR